MDGFESSPVRERRGAELADPEGIFLREGRTVRQILFVSLAGIGNLITQLPTVNKIKRLFPQASLDFVVSRDRGGKEILQGNPKVRKIIEISPLQTMSRTGMLALLLRGMGNRRYDLAMSGFPNQGLFSALFMLRAAKSRIQHPYPTRFGRESTWLLDSAPPVSRKHFVLLNLDLVPGLRKNVRSDFRLEYYETPEEAAAAEECLFSESSRPSVRIGLHPGSFWDMTWKRWSRDHWTELMRLLGKEIRSPRFYLFGTDMDGLEDFTARSDLVVVKNRPLRTVASLIRRMNLLVTGDSGLGHMASLFRVPQVVLFGGTDPAISRPFSFRAVSLAPKNHEPFYHPHHGFSGVPVPHIDRIPPREVADRILEILRTSPDDHPSVRPRGKNEGINAPPRTRSPGF